MINFKQKNVLSKSCPNKPQTAQKHSLLLGVGSDKPKNAATLMVGSLFILALQDAVVKLTSPEVTLWQFQIIRAVFNILFLILLTRLFWRSSCPPARCLWAVSLRSFFLASAMVTLFSGIPYLSLAHIAAGLYTFPLFVAMLSALFLREHVGPRRIIAIGTGFGGTLLILRPGADAFEPVSILPVTAALCYASHIFITRRLCRNESPITLSLNVSFAFLIFGILGLFLLPIQSELVNAKIWSYLSGGWFPINPYVFALIILCSVMNLTANLGLARAYQSAESSWLAPFDFSYIVFASFWGYVFWQDIPDKWTFSGMILITGAGIFVAFQEHLIHRQRRRSS